MIALSERLPPRHELFLVLAACIFPIHFWISIVLLYKFPSLILKANLWQIMGVFAYTFAFTLIESLLIFGSLVMIAIIFPTKFFRARFVHRGTLIAISIAVSALIINFWVLAENKWIISIIAISFLLLLIYLSQRPKESKLMNSFAERLTVISIIFIFTDMLSVFYIILRQFI